MIISGVESGNLVLDLTVFGVSADVYQDSGYALYVVGILATFVFMSRLKDQCCQ